MSEAYVEPYVQQNQNALPVYSSCPFPETSIAQVGRNARKRRGSAKSEYTSTPNIYGSATLSSGV